jgi:hypothetical protein
MIRTAGSGELGKVFRLFCYAAISFAVPRSLLGQVDFVQVSCASQLPPDAGAFPIDYGGKSDWLFDMDWEFVGSSGLEGLYSGHPDPATSFNTDTQGRSLKWTGISMRASCWKKYVVMEPPLPVKVSDYYEPTYLWGQLQYTGGTDDGNCDYQLISDPDTCTDFGGGGSGGSGGDPAEDGYSGSGDAGGDGVSCENLELEPGCYDVYVDDVYDSTICC